MIKNIHENEQVLHQIEWQDLVKEVKKHSFLDKTIDNIFLKRSHREITKIYNKTKLFQAQAQSEKYYLAYQGLTQLPSSANTSKFLRAIQKSSSLSIKDLNQIANFIQFYIKNFATLKELESNFLDKNIFDTFKQTIHKNFIKSFRTFVNESGDVDFEKHPKLRPLFIEKSEIEQHIRQKLKEILNSSELTNRLQFSSFDIVNERYVIPIKSDSYETNMGSIVSRSETGHTLFIEHSSVAKHNHRRLQLTLKIEEVLSKLELDYTVSLLPYINELNSIFKAVEFFDEYNTRQSFALSLNLTKPDISSTPIIDLKGMFHPLIEKPVTNDFFLDSKKQGFIISGPNTGGKTATLKTLALSQLMLKFGLYLPAKEAHIYQYENIYFFGNDQQNLEEGLSSFAAEVKNYIELLKQISDSNLILIDEVFNSTSSEEASALALSIFEKIDSIPSTHIVVSSHHQTLKTILHQSESFISAHVGFDSLENKPTYKIHVGAPGSSFALNIFKNMTSEDSIFEGLYERSIQFLDNKAIHYEKLLEKIAKKENELSHLLLSNEEINTQLINQKSAAEGIIKLKIDEAITEAQSEIKSHISKAQALIKDVQSQAIKKERKVIDKGQEILKSIKKLDPFPEKYSPQTHTNLSSPREFIEGEQYFSISLNKTVTIKRLNLKKQEALVSIGNLSIKTPLEKLKVANKTDSLRPKVSFGSIERTVESRVEYDCRGFRLEAFQDTVHKAISNLMIGDIPFIIIIHGHGSGVLKKWLRTFLKSHNDLEMVSNDSGNDGETRIVLKS